MIEQYACLTFRDDGIQVVIIFVFLGLLLAIIIIMEGKNGFIESCLRFVPMLASLSPRSEERRVGKEC